MSESFYGARGCVYRTGSGSRTSMYKLSPSISKGSEDSPVLIQGVSINDKDIFYPVTTVERAKIIYTAGSDFGEVSITGICLLGDAEKSAGGKSLKDVEQYWAGNRISKKKAPIRLSIAGNKAYIIYLVGLQIGEADPEYHIQPFVFQAVLAE